MAKPLQFHLVDSATRCQQPTKDFGWGWSFGAGGGGKGGGALTGKERVQGEETKSRSKTIVVSDTSASMEKVKKILEEIDKKPRQILIETRLVEVSADKLKDMGLDVGTGSSGSSSGTVTPTPISKVTNTTGSQNAGDPAITSAGGNLITNQITPSFFSPATTGLTSANTGFKLLVRKLRGNQFEVLYHALEEIANANTLSSPRVLTLDSQEAKILVGSQFPILESNTESGVTTQKLGYYQDIGIQLNVVPQISGEETINMIVHPSVSSFTSKVTTTGGAEYPIIDVREAETQVLMQSGETIVIGGLLKDVTKRQKIGVPLLGDIPVLGFLFQRRTNDLEKIDLLIFITAQIFEADQEVPRYFAAKPS